MSKKMTKWGVLLLAVGMSTAVGAAEVQKAPRDLRSPGQLRQSGDANYDCPATLANITLKVDSTLNAPRGWSPKPYPTEYKNMTLSVAHHAVSGNKLWCTYAYNATPGALRTTSISRPVPTGKTCTAEADFRFSCK